MFPNIFDRKVIRYDSEVNLVNRRIIKMIQVRKRKVTKYTIVIAAAIIKSELFVDTRYANGNILRSERR